MKRVSIFGWLLALLLLGSAGQPRAVAADDHPKSEHKETAHGGLPSETVADKAGIKRYDLGIYTAIVFLLLLVILGKYAWGPIIQMIDQRESNIKNEYVDAETARKEAVAYLDSVKAAQAKASDEVRGMIEEARRDAQALKDKLKADASAEIQAERERLRKEIETAKDQALQEIWSQAVQLAAMVSTKTLKREITPDDHRRLVDEALAELKTDVFRA